LLASVKAFSAFFALASADLVDFSSLTLAAVAASKAFFEALSLASKDEIRALAVAKASVVRKKVKSEYDKEANKGTRNKQSTDKKNTLGSPSSFQVFGALSAQGNEFLHQCLSRQKPRQYKGHTRNTRKDNHSHHQGNSWNHELQGKHRLPSISLTGWRSGPQELS
jgi:hypothetical protein